MAITVNTAWLLEYLDPACTQEELIDALPKVGLEVEETHDLKEALQTVRIGFVREKKPLAGADGLWACQIAMSRDEVIPVVCASEHEIEVGWGVPVARAGTKLLPTNKTIAAGHVHGARSEGMICLDGELGLIARGSGLQVFRDEAVIGKALPDVMAISESLLVVNVLPNRPDCLGMIGIAREVAALLGLKLKYPTHTRDKSPGSLLPGSVPVELRESQLCPRYTCQLIRGVRVGKSPAWLKSHLLAIGARPINNVVDATNFILHEWGQPLHAFDFRKIHGGRIVVRRMEPAEKMELLSGKVIDGAARPLVIADAERPIALAGIMGGRDTETNAQTVDVLLEGAYFDPVNIRQTVKKIDIGLESRRTESSFRYERGTDPNRMLEGAVQAACALITELAGGALEGGLTDQYPTPRPPRRFKLDATYTSAYLGLPVEAATIRERLNRLEMDVTPDLQVTVPTWRADVNDPVVLIEDVARLGDYDVIPTQAVPTLPTLGLRCDADRLRGVLADYLAGAGYFECRNPPLEPDSYSLAPVLRGEGGGEGSDVSGGQSRQSSPDPSPQPSPLSTGERRPDRRIHITNPSNREMTVLRESLLTGLLRSAERNLRRGATSVRLYEIDRTFRLDDAGEPQSRWSVAGVAGGILQELSWRGSSAKLDLYDVKGIVQNILDLVRVPHFATKPQDSVLYAPGLAAAITVDGVPVGRIGEVAAAAVDLGKSSMRLFAFELDLESLERHFKTLPRYQPLARTPAVTRDLAIVVSSKQPFGEIETAIRQTAGPSLETLRFVDLYRGPQFPPDHASLAFHLVFRDVSRTLTAEDVAASMEKIVGVVRERFGAQLRG